MNKLLIPALALCGALCVSAFAQDKKSDKPAPAQEKPAAQDKKTEAYKLGSTVDENLTLKDLDGKELKFKDLRGKVVFIHFWSKDCPYEKVADPKVQALEKKWEGKDVVVLAIASNKTEIGENPKDATANFDKIREHLKAKGLTNRVFADFGNRVADMFNAQHTPHCFVLDAKGVVVYMGGLDDDPKGDKGDATKQYVRDAVESTLAGKPVEVKESKPYGCSIKRVTSST